MTGPEAFLARHPDADHRYLSRVRAALEKGECENFDRWNLSLDEDFLSTYGRRAKGLARRNTPHAEQLSADIEGLLSQARAELGVETWWWRFELPRGRSVTLVERRQDHVILGGMATMSKLEVSDAEWAELWGCDGRAFQGGLINSPEQRSRAARRWRRHAPSHQRGRRRSRRGWCVRRHLVRVLRASRWSAAGSSHAPPAVR